MSTKGEPEDAEWRRTELEAVLTKLYRCPETGCPLYETNEQNEGCAEPLLGAQYPTLAIIGINPRRPGKDGKMADDNRFHDLSTYVSCFSENGECREIKAEHLKGRYRGYWAAYKRLIKARTKEEAELKLDKNEPSPSDVIDYNDKVTKLNIIKCPTIEKPSNDNLQRAWINCREYLIEQLRILQPKIILFHSRDSCNAGIELLLENNLYHLDDASHDLSDLSDPSKAKMGNFRDKFAIAIDERGRRTLFLFNWHLSYFGPADKWLRHSSVEFREKINEILHE